MPIEAAWLSILSAQCSLSNADAATGQVIEVCARVNPRLEIFRARFSALVHGDVTRALHNLVAPR